MDNVLDLLQQATLALCREGSIKDRLANAYATHLIQLDPEDLPEEVREEFSILCAAMRREIPQPRESAIRASIRKMSNEEATRHATRVVGIFKDMARLDALTAARRVTRKPALPAIVSLFAAEG